MTTPLLSVENLNVSYTSGRRQSTRVVHDVSLSLQAGEVLALVGESGSGKTTTAQAVLGLLAENGRIDSGAIRLNGEDISTWNARRLKNIRGTGISLIPQDPTSSLNPLRTVGDQVAESLRLHTSLDRNARRVRVLELLERVGLDDPELRLKQFPHELSGGMKQRVLIASAISLKPQLIIADEATSALDATVQKTILDLIDELRQQDGTAVLFVTHDLDVAADRADKIAVLKSGRVVESGTTAEVLGTPTQDYTRQLLADAPSVARGSFRVSRVPGSGEGQPDGGHDGGQPAVVVNSLSRSFDVGAGRAPFLAVDDVSFSVPAGSTHAIVGESGSGKTTTARILTGFLSASDGQASVAGVPVAGLKGDSLRQFRRKVQLVYQNPFTSLDPRYTVRRIVEEPLRNFRIGTPAEREAKVSELLERVHLNPSLLHRRPRELSGGQRQRVAIARALVVEPEVVVLDEAVSALDVTVQAQILRLLEELQDQLGLTYLFITHDLAVVKQIADSVTVMQHGRVVESGPTEQIFLNPDSDYTRTLIAAIPGGSARKVALPS